MTEQSYWSIRELLAETRPYGVGKTRLYKEYLTEVQRARYDVRYSSSGRALIPAGAVRAIIANVRAAYAKGSATTSRLAENLPAYRRCRSCRRMTNGAGAACRWCDSETRARTGE